MTSISRKPKGTNRPEVSTMSCDRLTPVSATAE